MGRGKKFTKGGREKEKLGKGEGKEKSFCYFSFPAPHPPPPLRFCHYRPNSPSLQRIQNSSKTLDRPPKPSALQATFEFPRRTTYTEISIKKTMVCYSGFDILYMH